jgi:hypothetical protein
MLNMKTCTRVLYEDTCTIFPFTTFSFEDLHQSCKASVMTPPNSGVLLFARVRPSLHFDCWNSTVRWVSVSRVYHTMNSSLFLHKVWHCWLPCHMITSQHLFWTPAIYSLCSCDTMLHFNGSSSLLMSNKYYTRLILFISFLNWTKQQLSLSATAWRHILITFPWILLLKFERLQNLTAPPVAGTRFNPWMLRIGNRNDKPLSAVQTVFWQWWLRDGPIRTSRALVSWKVTA